MHNSSSQTTRQQILRRVPQNKPTSVTIDELTDRLAIHRGNQLASDGLLLGQTQLFEARPQPRQRSGSYPRNFLEKIGGNVLVQPVSRNLAQPIRRLLSRPQPRQRSGGYPRNFLEKIGGNVLVQPVSRNLAQPIRRLSRPQQQPQLDRETPFNGSLNEKVEDTSSDDEPIVTDHLASLVQQQQQFSQLDISGIAAVVDYLTHDITLNYKNYLNEIIKYIDKDIVGIKFYIKYLKIIFSDVDILNEIKIDLIQFEKKHRGVFRVNKKSIQDVINHKKEHIYNQIEYLQSNLKNLPFDVEFEFNRQGLFELIGKPLSEIINHQRSKKKYKVIERIETHKKKTNEKLHNLITTLVCLEILSLIVGEEELSSPSLETLSYPQPQQASPQNYYNIRGNFLKKQLNDSQTVLPNLPQISLNLKKRYPPLQIEKLTVFNDENFF
jgi:hypothetical protein